MFRRTRRALKNPFVQGVIFSSLIDFAYQRAREKQIKHQHQTELAAAREREWSDGWERGWRSGRSSLGMYLNHEFYEKMHGPFEG